MRKSSITNAELLARANYACEYCRIPLTGTTFERDHIKPLDKGGQHKPENLAVACKRCNLNKSSNITSPDPFTWRNQPLFNPRLMSWSDHFRVVRGEVVGKTPIGNATAYLLFKHIPSFAAPNLHWEEIDYKLDSEPLNHYLNELRYLRVRNEFAELDKLLDMPIPQNISSKASKRDLRHADFIRCMLMAETLFTRSRPIDVRRGLELSAALIHKHRDEPAKLQLSLDFNAVFHQQKSTISFLLGDKETALLGQRAANAYLRQKSQILKDEASKNQMLAHMLTIRGLSFGYKYRTLDTPNTCQNEVITIASELDIYQAAPYYSYLTDVVLLDEKPNFQFLEKLYRDISDRLAIAGYATAIDIARYASLRRRWWALHMLFEPEPWLDTLNSDLDFMTRTELQNELREVRALILRMKDWVDKAVFGRIWEVTVGHEQRRGLHLI